MSDTPPLGAIDLFHLRAHHEMRHQGLHGNACALVVELAGRVPLAKLEQRLCDGCEAMPELRYQLARDRRLAYCWKPTRRVGSDILRVQQMADQRAVLARTVQLLNAPVNGKQPWSLRLLRGPTSDALVLRWFHPLMDALGAQRLLRWLGGELPPPPAKKRWMTSDRLLKKADRNAQIAMARAYTEHVMKLGKAPTVSLYGARGARSIGHMAALRLLFSQEETTRFDAGLKARAKLADTSLIVWAAARMIDRILATRGYTPTQQLIPLPVSLDPKRGGQRMFGNHLTMMMMSLDRSQLADEAAAVAGLANQRREVIRGKHDVGILAGLRLAWRLPSPLFSWFMRRPFGGERSTFVVSNPGAVDIDALFDVPVVDAFTAPAALASPGFQLIASRHGARLSLMMVYLNGLVQRAELASQLDQLRADLLSS